MGTVDRLEATTDKCTANLKNCYTLRLYMYCAEPHQVVDEHSFSALILLSQFISKEMLYNHAG